MDGFWFLSWSPWVPLFLCFLPGPGPACGLGAAIGLCRPRFPHESPENRDAQEDRQRHNRHSRIIEPSEAIRTLWSPEIGLLWSSTELREASSPGSRLPPHPPPLRKALLAVWGQCDLVL